MRLTFCYILIFVQLVQSSSEHSSGQCSNGDIKAEMSDLKETVFGGKTMSTLIGEKMNQFQGKLNDMEDKLESIEERIQDLLTPPKNCADRYNRGEKTPSLVKIYPFSCCPDEYVSVMCDQGWTTIQQRKVVQPREDFHRNWTEYSNGFGNLNGEFWLGLKAIHELTHQSPQQLYITLEDWENNTRSANYSSFSVAGPNDNYRITVTGFTGDAGDAMEEHNGMEFSTYDRDNDAHDSHNCAKAYNRGGWWLNHCHHANLNGQPDWAKEGTRAAGINWEQWRTNEYSLKAVSMKIRPLLEGV